VRAAAAPGDSHNSGQRPSKSGLMSPGRETHQRPRLSGNKRLLSVWPTDIASPSVLVSSQK
jgi:hypothetical protein